MQDTQKSNINLENLTQNLHDGSPRDEPKIYHDNYSLKNQLVRHFIERTNVINEEAAFKFRDNHCALMGKIAEQNFYQLQAKASKWNGNPGIYYYSYNNTSLCAAGGFNSTRTAVNQRKRLRDTGFFIDEVFTGIGFKALINPLFYFNLPNNFLAVDKYVHLLKKFREAGEANPAQMALNAAWVEHFAPLKNFSANKFNKEYNKHVDKLTERQLLEKSLLNEISGARSGQGLGIKKKQKSPGESSAVCQNDATQKAPTVNAERRAEKQKKEGPARAARAAAAGFLFSIVTQFWEYAKIRLYPGWDIEPETTQKIISTIYAQYFNPEEYGQLSQGQWLEYQKMMLERVDIAADWFGRRPGVKIPYPTTYFGASSPVPWIKAKEMRFSRTLDFYKTRLFSAQLKSIQWEVINTRKGKGKYKDYTALELYKLHEKRVIRSGNANFINKFYEVAKTLYRNV